MATCFQCGYPNENWTAPPVAAMAAFDFKRAEKSPNRDLVATGGAMILLGVLGLIGIFAYVYSDPRNLVTEGIFSLGFGLASLAWKGVEFYISSVGGPGFGGSVLRGALCLLIAVVVVVSIGIALFAVCTSALV